jgi:hypothetical protein
MIIIRNHVVPIGARRIQIPIFVGGGNQDGIPLTPSAVD